MLALLISIAMNVAIIANTSCLPCSCFRPLISKLFSNKTRTISNNQNKNHKNPLNSKNRNYFNPMRTVSTETDPSSNDLMVNVAPNENDLDSIKSQWTPYSPQHRDYVTQLFEPDKLSLRTDEQISSSSIEMSHTQSINRQANYDWDEFLFETLPLTQDRKLRNSMLISIHLYFMREFNEQIDALFDSSYLLSIINPNTTRQEEIKKMYGTIKYLASNIPSLYHQDKSEEITDLIIKTFEYYSKIESFLKEGLLAFSRIIDSEVVDHSKNVDSKLVNNGQEIDKQEMMEIDQELYNQAIKAVDYNEQNLNDKYKSGKDRTFKPQTFDGKALCMLAIKDLEDINLVFRAILALINENGKILYHKDDMEPYPDLLDAVFKTIFPDVKLSLQMQIFNKLKTVYDPASFIILLGTQLMVHSRQSYWGKYHQNIKFELTSTQIIKHDPFDVIHRIEISDNCPPMQKQQLSIIQCKIKTEYLKILMVHKRLEKNFDGNELQNVDEKWINNVFLLGSVIMSELDGGRIGIINHYDGTGKITDISRPTRTIFFEYSLLKNDPRGITLDDIESNGVKIMAQQDQD